MTFSKKVVGFVNRHTFALATLSLCVLAYAPLISALGFYWDDWRVILHVHTGRLANMVEFFAYDRPFSVWTVLLFAPILGTSPLAWHIFSVALRWLLTLAMAWSLRLIWPLQRRAIAWAALLFTVYPVYFQQPVAVAFSQHLIAYVLLFVSLGAMVMAIRQPNNFWQLTLLALITQLAHLVTVEHFVGLELMRPVFLFIVIKELGSPRHRTIQDVLRIWLPYLLVLVFFTLWRLFWLEFPVEPHTLGLVLALQANPLKAMLDLFMEMIQGLVHALGTTWYRTLRPEFFDLGNLSQLFSWFIGGLAGIGLYLWGKRMHYGERATQGSLASWIWIGTLAVLLGLLPIWLIGEQIIEIGYNEHLALPAMFGATLFGTGLVMTMIEKHKYQILIMAFLIGLSVAGQLRATNELRNDWQEQQRLYRQLDWRAPAIKPNTALVSFERLSTYMQNSSVSAALNTLYPQSQAPPYLDYWNFELTFSDNVAKLENGKQLTASDRSLQFAAEDADSNLLYFLPEVGCLWVLTPLDVHNQYLPPGTRVLAVHSNPNRILRERGEGLYAAMDIFGKSNTNTWCYYFEQAELARQFEDWEEVTLYYSNAFNSGLNPDNGIEFIGLVDAYAHLGDWEMALEVSREIASRHVKNLSMLCALWDELAAHKENDTPVNILSMIGQFADCEWN